MMYRLRNIAEIKMKIIIIFNLVRIVEFLFEWTAILLITCLKHDSWSESRLADGKKLQIFTKKKVIIFENLLIDRFLAMRVIFMSFHSYLICFETFEQSVFEFVKKWLNALLSKDLEAQNCKNHLEDRWITEIWIKFVTYVITNTNNVIKYDILK